MKAAELYDSHGAAAYAVALRITGDAARASQVVTDVFEALAGGMELPAHHRSAGLIRAVRDLALTRRDDRNPVSNVVGSDPSPRSMVEAAFFEGRSVAELAAAHSLTEAAVRARLRDGMAELRAGLHGKANR